ncbi:CPBP family intramembrane glutamic endopeptidase [Propionibacterium freudenreichii]|uniref:CPBP family intramembrane glutamic endopeptidase n=1 Tax=Propionibacterium freudenreichii TaxID=1744 RepID=UPI0021A2C9A8|nr:type II CAAX endopeptidase family protein [Propionibacterium freudenreichii]MDK9663118.1 CPBP family intramembrane metalloprotease [Propionibacterium freudenreichii]
MSQKKRKQARTSPKTSGSPRPGTSQGARQAPRSGSASASRVGSAGRGSGRLQPDYPYQPMFTMPASEPMPGVDYALVMRSPAPGGAMRAITGLALVAAGYLLITQILLYLGAWLSWLARGQHGSMQDGYAAVAGYQVPEGIVIVNLALAAAIIVVLVIARWCNGRQPGWLVSVRPGMRWGFLACAVVVGLVVLNGIYLLAPARAALHWNPPSNAWLLMVLVVVTSPLQAAGEEFLFRGYLQQALGALTGRSWVALIVSALVFAAMHGSQNLPLFIDRFGFGLIAGGMVLATGGLEASIAAHAANNVSSFGYAIAGGTLAQTRQISASNWATTGSNVVGYLVTGVAMVAVARLLRLRRVTPDTPS